MKEVISTYAPGVNEVFAAVDIQEKTKTVEFENKLFSSKTALSGLKEHTTEQDYSNEQDGMQA